MDNPPPLGNGLFSELTRAFPDSWGDLPTELASKFRERFEGGIEAAYGKYPGMITLLNHMGRYFTQFNIDDHSQSLYFRLIQRYQPRFQSNEFLVSTINYECLIEEAALQLFPEITCFGSGQGFKVLKLHGSCNFLPQKIRVGLSQKMNLGTARFDLPLKCVSPEVALKELQHNQFPPAMSLYATDKTNVACETQIRTIQAEFHKAVEHATLVLVVGANPYPDDRHIWDHVAATKAEVVLIGGEDGCRPWLTTNRGGEKWLGDRFAASFDDLCDLLDERTR